MSIPVALQVFSVRNEAKEDLRSVLEKIKEMGYDGVEFAGLYGHTPEEVKEMCETIGLVPVSAHVPPQDLLDRPEVFDEYKRLGCEYVVVPYLPNDYRPETGKFDVAIANAKKVGKAAKEHGLQLLYHNHEFEFAIVGGEYSLDRLYRETTPDELQTELDTCWINIGGENPSEYIRKYSGRSPVVHLKDFVGERTEDMYELIGVDCKKPKRPADFEFRPLGYGLQDFKEIIKAAEDAGSKWLVVEQDHPSMGLSPMECAKKSREYLKTIGY